MLLVVGILLIFGLIVRHKWRNGAAKKEEILRLVAAASQQEALIAKLQAIEEYNSSIAPTTLPPPQQQLLLERHHFCAVCQCPTTTRCSRCKAVRYCSGKCQIIHWRQGHKDDCQPATTLRGSKESEYSTQTATENQFVMLSQNEAKFFRNTSQEPDHFGSSSSSGSGFFSSTERSDTSSDASTSEFVELGTPPRPGKASSVGIGSHMSQAISDSENADVQSPSLPVFSVNHSAKGDKIEKSLAAARTKFKDIREGDVIPVIKEFVPCANELRNSQSSNSTRTSSTEDWKNQAHPYTSQLSRSISVRASGDHQMPNLVSRSSPPRQSAEYWVKEPKFCNSKETRSSSSSGYSLKLPAKTDGARAIPSEFDDVRILSHSTANGLKTSVRKLVHHFRAPKQSKSTSDMVNDSGGYRSDEVVFPLKLFMQLYSSDHVKLRPFGLVNCGNSCYANAVLQCLTFTRPITSYLLQGLHSKTCWKRDWCFISKLEHLIQNGQETNSPLSPVGLLSLIQPIGREEDAHEFLRNVVDKMQSICLEEAGVSGSLAEDSTLMGLTFGGYLRSKIKCMKCLGRSEQCDRMMDLNVEIDGNIYTLEDALLQFTSSETLGGDDKYKCNRCKSYQKAKKKLTILEAPNILTVVLKRFRSGNLEKLNKLIKFPEVLNLSHYMSEKMSDKYPIYHLYGVVVHLGTMNDADSGHYISYVKDFRGDWFKVDDNRVSHVDLETVLSVEAYILFYARHSPRGLSFVRSSIVHHPDGKPKRNMEAISSSNNTKKKNSKSSSGRNTESTLPHLKDSDWISPDDFTGNPEGWGFQSKHRSPIILDSSSDSSSIFSTSDAGSYI